MIKKPSRLGAYLCLLLCLCILLVSCGSKSSDSDSSTAVPQGGLPQDTGEEEEIEEEDPIPQNEAVDYQAIIGEWNQYLAYRDSEEVPSTTAEKLYTITKGQTEVREYGVLHWVTDDASDTVYNMKKGIRILSLPRGSASERYEISIEECMIEVKRSTSISAANGENASEWVDAYYYYTSDGVLLNEEPLKGRITPTVRVCEDPQYCFVSMFDRCYLTKGGEIRRTFEEGQERWIPEPHVEYNGYGYIFEESSIRILDSEARETVHYRPSDVCDEMRTEILSDGSVLVIYTVLCSEEELDYDTEMPDGNKIKLSYEVIDAKTGAVERIPADFWIGSMVTPYDDNGTNLALKGDYQFAEIYKITDQTCSEEPCFAILNSRLETVAELPRILKNQDGVVRALNARTLILHTMGGQYYSVDLLNCIVSLSLNESACEKTTVGWIQEGGLYDGSMNLLADLTQYERYAVAEGRLLVWEETYDGSGVWRAFRLLDGDLRSFAFNGEDMPIYDATRNVYLETYYDSVKEETYTICYSEKGIPLFRGNLVEWVDLGDGVYLAKCEIGGTVGQYAVWS